MLTIGDLIDVTPKEQINKVRLEEKIFETWHLGRIVLIGDGEFFGKRRCGVLFCAANWVVRVI